MTSIARILFVIATVAAGSVDAASLTGSRKTWHRVTLTFDGPTTAETADPNPFTHYRLTVTFTNGQTRYVVPGFFAADGDAAETGATDGSKWRAHFVPDRPGTWTYRASFREGEDVALSDAPDAGRAVRPDAEGQFVVEPTDKTGRDFRAHGTLRYVGERYLRFAGSGRRYLKGGADSPENFLAYAGLDGTYRAEQLERRKGENFAEQLHQYQPHVQDWQRGDPTWRDGKGKAIIGALNYLASEGMNSVYMLTMNVGGDGKDVWPWTGPATWDRFDCSKLSQWEIIFSHMDRKGLQLHLITQEQENDQLLDGGALGRHRQLYYRELIARYSHHLAIVWNLGEENTNTDDQRKAFTRYIRALDPYDHPIVSHTFPGQYQEVYGPLLGYEHFEGPSIQLDALDGAHHLTSRWLHRSATAGRPWFVCIDEPGTAGAGVKPDAVNPAHDAARQRVLWANLMAGGSGVEWYFGYNFAHNDLNCEDWRSRDRLWDQTRHALTFFQRHLPFEEMSAHDELVGDDAHCLAQPGEVYAVYLPGGGTTVLDLPGGSYRLRWYNPREGELHDGTVRMVEGGQRAALGHPPEGRQQDWALLVERQR